MATDVSLLAIDGTCAALLLIQRRACVRVTLNGAHTGSVCVCLALSSPLYQESVREEGADEELGEGQVGRLVEPRSGKSQVMTTAPAVVEHSSAAAVIGDGRRVWENGRSADAAP